MEGRKDDQEKIMTHLYPVDALLETCQVLTYGAKKYEPRNWEKGFEWSRAYGAALRHLFAFWQGEDLDPETGISHLAHAACEVAFLQSFHIREIGKDDRPIETTILRHTTTDSRVGRDDVWFSQPPVPPLRTY